MKHVGTLIVLVISLGSTARAQAVPGAPACYTVTWDDSLRSYNLPPILRLETRPDSAFRSDARVVTLPGVALDSTTGQLPWAAWTPVSRDSLKVDIIVWPPIHWRLFLGLHRDSAIGRVWGTAGEGAMGPYQVHARHVECR